MTVPLRRAVQFSFQSRRFLSSTTDPLIYATPNALFVKLAKIFSLSTLTVSSVSTPAIMYFWDNPAVQAAGLNEYLFMGESTLRYITLHGLSLAFAASLGSTGALHYLLSPFINAIYLRSGSRTITPNTQVTMETLDVLARRRHTTVALKDLEPSSGLLLTWTVRKQHQKGLPQTRFWLDKRNGVGDREAMRKILRITAENQQQKRVVL